MVSLNISEKPNFTRPDLLLHPRIPKELAGVNPRTIEGKHWWDAARHRAYRVNNYCCWACGVPRLDAPEQLLDAHECYEYDEQRCVAHFVEVVALCRTCHGFIHYDNIENLQLLKYVLEHGLRTLHEAELPLPASQVRTAKYWCLYLPFLDTATVTLMVQRSPRPWRLLYKGVKYPCNSVHQISHRVRLYYERRNLKWPTTEKALLFVQTELGEASEVLLAKGGEWTYNNPEDKEEYSPERFAEELGDVIMMAIVAGLQSGVDPIAAMLAKMERKMSDARKGQDGPSET